MGAASLIISWKNSGKQQETAKNSESIKEDWGGARVARPHFLLLLALLMLTGEAFGLVAQFDRNISTFVVAVLLQGAVWAVAACVVARGSNRRSALVVVLATAILLRVGALAAP